MSKRYFGCYTIYSVKNIIIVEGKKSIDNDHFTVTNLFVCGCFSVRTKTNDFTPRQKHSVRIRIKNYRFPLEIDDLTANKLCI